ncbi:MAG: hypothetical protein Q8L86_17035 [Vicinamibacterales bacterium]|nr:hypothetical protein [Vicinamibacterales bacterium]
MVDGLLGFLVELSGRVVRLEAENRYLRDEVRRLEAASGGETRGPGRAGETGILTRDDLRRVERDNLRRALDACDWRIFGPRGAAARLGMRPTTLASRLKTLGLRRAVARTGTPGIPEF